MTQEEILNIFRETGALSEGHFELTSGYHSPHYFQCAKVLQYPEYNSLFATEIAQNFINDNITLVISPAIGGITLGTEIGRKLDVRNIFTERENNKMILRRGFEIFDSDRILICEDVVTTGGSVLEIIDLIRSTKAELIGVGFIIDRTGGKINFGVKHVSLAQVEVKKYSPDKLPEWLKKIPVTKPGSRKK